MKSPSRQAILLIGMIAFAIHVFGSADELDRVAIFVNDHRVGTWRDGDEQVLHLDSLNDGDTIIFRAHTDLGGLGNSDIEIQDNSGLTIDHITNIHSTESEAEFTYVYDVKHINNKISNGTINLVIILELAPERQVAPRTIAYMILPKK